MERLFSGHDFTKMCCGAKGNVLTKTLTERKQRKLSGKDGEVFRR